MSASPSASTYEFANLANAFCAWCEGPSLGAEKGVSIAVWLATLHAAALTLPKVEPQNKETLPNLPEAALAQARGNFACFNGWYYREFFDPDPALEDEPGIGDIGDDLLDIYQDIKAGSLLFERGEVTEALWHWSFLHRVHWGRHAVGALFALHCLSAKAAES